MKYLFPPTIPFCLQRESWPWDSPTIHRERCHSLRCVSAKASKTFFFVCVFQAQPWSSGLAYLSLFFIVFSLCATLARALELAPWSYLDGVIFIGGNFCNAHLTGCRTYIAALSLPPTSFAYIVSRIISRHFHELALNVLRRRCNRTLLGGETAKKMAAVSSAI